MPKENRKRGRREDKKRKREEEEDQTGATKRQKSEDVQPEADYVPLGEDAGLQTEPYTTYVGPEDFPFYGLLDEGEQEYFKRADSMLEVNQFPDPGERELFLANVYKEANGKELKLASSQSCSRLMERLILLSTAEQLKSLFQKFNGQFIHLVQHRFSSHCCEALFLQAAPFVSEELKAAPPDSKQDGSSNEVFVSMEGLFLQTVEELEANLGYLMTDRFASHTLRILLVVLSGMPLSAAGKTSLLQSKKKEKVSIPSHVTVSEQSGLPRSVPDSFHVAVDKVIQSTSSGLDTTALRALATHPLANPVLQLLLELELTRSKKQSAKDQKSLSRKLLPDDPSDEGTESAAFINHMLYDTVGSRLLEVVVTHAPGKIFKSLYRTSLKDKLGTLAKNEIAVFVVIKVIERLGREDLQSAVEQLCPQISILIDRSRTSLIKSLIERCRTREVDVQPIAGAIQQLYGSQSSELIPKFLNLDPATNPDTNMSEDRKKQLESQDVSKVHRSLLLQTMLETPGPLRDIITDSLLAIDDSALLTIAKDRTASRILQSSLTSPDQSPKFRRLFISRFYDHVTDLALDPVASHLVDAFWAGSAGLIFIKERIATELAKSELRSRDSVPGRAVWRNWKMDLFQTRRTDWMAEAKGQQAGGKTGIELARERFVVSSSKGKGREGKGKLGGTGIGSNGTA